jgi:hypothetical protein
MGKYEENQKKVDNVLERGIGILARNYNVKKLDAGEYADAVTMNTQFRIAHYDIENVGHLLTMYTENNPQMMMATYILMPYYKKLPMVSADYMYNEDGGMILIELYELVKDRGDEKFGEWIGRYSERFKDIADIEDMPTAPSYFDTIRPVFVCKKRDADRDQDCIQCFVDTLKIFIDQEKSETPLDEAEAAAQKEVQHKYADDLIEQNGVSTKVWVNEHGIDYVKKMYHEVFFGV